MPPKTQELCLNCRQIKLCHTAVNLTCVRFENGESKEILKTKWLEAECPLCHRTERPKGSLVLFGEICWLCLNGFAIHTLHKPKYEVY